MLDWFESLLDKFGDFLKNLLPTDPFADLLSDLETSSFAEYIGYINFFFPVGFFIDCLSAFLVALGIYYLYVIIMRWLKAVS